LIKKGGLIKILEDYQNDYDRLYSLVVFVRRKNMDDCQKKFKRKFDFNIKIDVQFKREFPKGATDLQRSARVNLLENSSI
jgi:hypothetical protein